MLFGVLFPLSKAVLFDHNLHPSWHPRAILSFLPSLLRLLTTPAVASQPTRGRGEKKKISWSPEEKLVSSYVSGLPRAANFRRLLLLGITFVTCIGLGSEGGRLEG